VPSIKIPRRWEIPESGATPEDVYLNRRRFLRATGLVGLGTIALGSSGLGCVAAEPEKAAQGATRRIVYPEPDAWKGIYPVKRNERFALDRLLTDEVVAGTYNNFYEFTTDKPAVAALAKGFPVHPWKVEVGGLVGKPKTFDIDDLVRTMPLEERLYRHRCVEAWAMSVPWTGFPFKALIDKVEPLSSAKFVRLVSFHKPELAVGQAMQSWYPWPYYEALTMAEAVNDLAMLVTGIYGHALPVQHGAPMRLVVPWKYGFKSIKSIVKIEFIESMPPTFWNDVAPREYLFEANVEPDVPHPRWSQAFERLIGTDMRVPTRKYNGYREHVEALYV